MHRSPFLFPRNEPKIILTPKFSHQNWELAQRGSPCKGPVSAMKRGCCRRAKRALINDCSPVKLPNWVEGYLSTKKATALLCVTLTAHISQVRLHSQPSNSTDQRESTVPRQAQCAELPPALQYQIQHLFCFAALLWAGGGAYTAPAPIAQGAECWYLQVKSRASLSRWQHLWLSNHFQLVITICSLWKGLKPAQQVSVFLFGGQV